jgi:hypothetical protein
MRRVLPAEQASARVVSKNTALVDFPIVPGTLDAQSKTKQACVIIINTVAIHPHTSTVCGATLVLLYAIPHF